MKKVKLGKKEFVVMSEEERQNLETYIRNIDRYLFIYDQLDMMYKNAREIKASLDLRLAVKQERMQAWSDLYDAISDAHYSIRNF